MSKNDTPFVLKAVCDNSSPAIIILFCKPIRLIIRISSLQKYIFFTKKRFLRKIFDKMLIVMLIIATG